MCDALADVRKLLREVPLALLKCAPDDMDCVQEDTEPLKDENKVLTDTIAEFTNAFLKHMWGLFGPVSMEKSGQGIKSNGAVT